MIYTLWLIARNTCIFIYIFFIYIIMNSNDIVCRYRSKSNLFLGNLKSHEGSLERWILDAQQFSNISFNLWLLSINICALIVLPIFTIVLVILVDFHHVSSLRWVSVVKLPPQPEFYWGLLTLTWDPWGLSHLSSSQKWDTSPSKVGHIFAQEFHPQN